jgi:hypothetical protein
LCPEAQRAVFAARVSIDILSSDLNPQLFTVPAMTYPEWARATQNTTRSLLRDDKQNLPPFFGTTNPLHMASLANSGNYSNQNMRRKVRLNPESRIQLNRELT